MEQLGWVIAVIIGMASIAIIFFMFFGFFNVEIGEYIEAKAKKIEAEAEAIRCGKKEAAEA